MMNQWKQQTGLYWILIFSAVCFGGFYDWAAVLIGTAASVIGLLKIYKSGKCLWIRDKTIMLLLVIGLGLCLSLGTAVDRGMAFVGILRFLPVLIWMFLCMQYTQEERDRALQAIPHAGCLMILVGMVSLLNEKMAASFWAADRLGGFFQYSNTCAVFFLVGMILLRERKKRYQNIMWSILFWGFLLTGSRGAFLLAIPTFAFWVIRGKKEERVFLVSHVGIAMLFSCVIVFTTGNYQNLARIWTIFSSNSTFYGRLLYWKDAVELIMKYPLGLGSYGYFYLQPEIQTGVYKTLYVHNDILQMFLDGGWLAGIGIIGYAVLSLKNSRYRLCSLVLILHSLIDFDLQYPLMWMALILFTGFSQEYENVRGMQKRGCQANLAIAAFVLAYFIPPFLMDYQGNYGQAIKLYPGHTEAACAELSVTGDADLAVERADAIISRNPHISLAWDAKALAAYAAGDLEQFCRYKERVLTIERYDITQYEDYTLLLLQAAEEIRRQGDSVLAENLKKRAWEIPMALLMEVEQCTSLLAYRIQEKPDFVMFE